MARAVVRRVRAGVIAARREESPDRARRSLLLSAKAEAPTAAAPSAREGGSESSEDGDLDPYLLELVHAKLALFDLPLPKL